MVSFSVHWRGRPGRLGAIVAVILLQGLSANPSYAQEPAQEHQEHQESIDTESFSAHQSEHTRKQHLSVFLGDTRLLRPGESDYDAFTIGIDYEYRVNRRFGAGFVAEYAVDPLDATSVLAALDVHFYKGLVVQLGLGVEFIEGNSNELGRIGVLYEFEFGHTTLSPQFHWDVTSAEDSLVFGIAIGRNF